MKVIIASKNPNKIEAVKEAFKIFELKSKFDNQGVDSQVSAQPLSIEETLQGAKNRAKNVFEKNQDFKLGIGIESGAFSIEGEDDLFIINFCSIYDGEKFYSGASSAFKLPKEISKLLKEGEELTNAVQISCFSKRKDEGYNKGLINIISLKKLNRKDLSTEAVRNALIDYLNHEN